MGQQGAIFTAEAAKNYLKEANKNYLGQQTWLEAYNALSDAANQTNLNYESTIADIDKSTSRQISDLGIDTRLQESLLTQDYSADIAEAYKSAMAQRQGIAASNLGQGYKEKALLDTDLALESAYDSYRRNFLANKSNLASKLVSNVGGIYRSAISSKEDVYKRTQDELELIGEAQTELDTMLEKQAQNTADYLNAHFDYLEALYEKEPESFSGADFYDYIDYSLVDGTLTPGGLKDINAIRNMMFDEGGELNERGQMFFKQIENYGVGSGYTFGDYLYDTNKELYDWSVGINPYDTSYTDLEGINTNRISALGMIMGGEGGKVDTRYETTNKTIEDLRYANTKSTETDLKDLGKAKEYGEDLDRVIMPTDIETIGLKDRDNENFHIKFTGADGKKHSYYLEATKDEIDDAITDKIDKLVGGISNGKLYFSDGVIYVGIVDKDGKKKLRKVQGQGLNAGNGDYQKLISNFN